MSLYEGKPEDAGLNRHVLYDWLYARSTISDDAFAFVDDFIRHTQYADPAYEKILDEITSRMEEEVRAVLKHLYVAPGYTSSDHQRDYFSYLEKSVYVSSILSAESSASEIAAFSGSGRITQIAVRLYDFRDGIGRAKALYSKIPFRDMGELSSFHRSNYYVYDGYVIISGGRKEGLSGVLNLYRSDVKGLGYPNSQSSSTFSCVFKPKNKFPTEISIMPNDSFASIIEDTNGRLDFHHEQKEEPVNADLLERLPLYSEHVFTGSLMGWLDKLTKGYVLW